MNSDWVVLRKEILDHVTDRAQEDRFPLTPQRIVHDVRQLMLPDGIVGARQRNVQDLVCAQLSYRRCKHASS